MSDEEPTRRFVLLAHELPSSSDRRSHYDLMLEQAEDLFTLELLEPPSIGVPLRARELAPHRKAYLDYEGPISGDRGEVRRIDRGEFTVARWNEALIEVDLSGEGLRGRLTLERAAAPEGNDDCWRLTLRRPG